MFSKLLLSRHLLLIRSILGFNLAVLSIFSTFAIPALAATNNSGTGLSSSEISQIQKISDLQDLDTTKKIIQNELKTNKSDSYKKFISTQIAVSKTEVSNVDTILPSKYNSTTKNYQCKEGTTTVTSYALAGNRLFSFSLRTNACVDSSKVYSGFIRSTWADIYAIGWSYYGETPDRNFSYINNSQTEYVASKQGLFKLCVNSNWACAQETRPWIERHVVREGRIDYSYSS
jgi:hypothetical protein